MVKLDSETLGKVRDLLEGYEREVEATGLQPSSKRTYILHARHFVRWLDDDFDPGSNVDKVNRPSRRRNPA